VTFYILLIALLILIPAVIGVAYVVRNASNKRVRAGGAGAGDRPKNADPVTLDRNPEMPHRPGATS
jgi:hypothetical protein